LHQRVGQRFQRLNRIFVPLRLEIVGKFAPRKVGVAMADKNEISVQPAVAVERTGGFDGGAEFVIGTDQGERAAVVKSFVFEAGVKSLSAFCEYSVLPVARERFRFPESRARSGALSTPVMRCSSDWTGAGGTGAASSGASIAKTKKTKPATESPRDMQWIVTPAKTGLVLE